MTGPIDAVQATATANHHAFGALISNQGSPADSSAPDTRDNADAYPSRCESPLLPMGQTLSHQTGADRLSQQRGQVGSRQSQLSVARKDYAIHDEDEYNNNDNDDAKDRRMPPGITGTMSSSGRSRTRPHMNRPRMIMPRAKSYRIHAPGDHHTSPVRDLSSKFKSACRKLNPKRLGKSSAQPGQEDNKDDAISGETTAAIHEHQLGGGSSSNRRGT